MPLAEPRKQEPLSLHPQTKLVLARGPTQILLAQR